MSVSSARNSGSNGNGNARGNGDRHRPGQHRGAENKQGAAKNPEDTGKKKTVRDRFVDAARFVSDIVGSASAFAIAILIVVVWALTGPLFGFSDTWQLVINTGTTIVTFLMVFLIQSTQNRDAKAVHLKLDELIRALKGARNSLVDLEHLSEKELEDLAGEFSTLSKRACAEVERRGKRGHGEKSENRETKSQSES
ncbi:MAG TPA: low affinity iron permease family protein [Chthoniobacteraceae bacterium]|nr:low affinity iron permease family protein [Chthoniobacteraceae bacterium]